jgi:hypothetical protein
MEVFLPVRIFAVRLVITFHYNGMRAKPFGGIHGHGGVHAEFPGLIITGSDYAAATNQDRFTNQLRLIRRSTDRKKLSRSRWVMWREERGMAANY